MPRIEINIKQWEEKGDKQACGQVTMPHYMTRHFDNIITFPIRSSVIEAIDDVVNEIKRGLIRAYAGQRGC